MTINTNKTVGELAVELPAAARVFEKAGIDYCCGGGESFEKACAAAGIAADEVARLLEVADQSAAQPAQDWQTQPLSGLTSYIVTRHHVFTREELARLDDLLEKVRSVHGQNHPELLLIQGLYRELKQELTTHMQKEELVLFPYIEQLDEAARQGKPKPMAIFGTVANPVRMMMMEHDAAGEVLKQMRRVSRSFRVPPDGCISYSTLYQALEAFEQDLHQHIHLENNILFPRAVEMESKV
ncbi:MAG: iron-sulfur cluster repair di-iron protein [Blastocatellia bacterium]